MTREAAARSSEVWRGFILSLYGGRAQGVFMGVLDYIWARRKFTWLLCSMSGELFLRGNWPFWDGMVEIRTTEVLLSTYFCVQCCTLVGWFTSEKCREKISNCYWWKNVFSEKWYFMYLRIYWCYKTVKVYMIYCLEKCIQIYAVFNILEKRNEKGCARISRSWLSQTDGG